MSIIVIRVKYGEGGGCECVGQGPGKDAGKCMYFIIGVFSVYMQYNCVYYCDTWGWGGSMGRGVRVCGTGAWEGCR
jgi:hypothetical protein